MSTRVLTNPSNNALVAHHSALLSSFDGLVQNCSNYIANALELLQSCTKSSIQEPFTGAFYRLHKQEVVTNRDS